MKAAIQGEATGFGIASVAAIAGVSYAGAKKTSNRMKNSKQRLNTSSEECRPLSAARVVRYLTSEFETPRKLAF
jgi:hypothetical protein